MNTTGKSKQGAAMGGHWGPKESLIQVTNEERGGGRAQRAALELDRAVTALLNAEEEMRQRLSVTHV